MPAVICTSTSMRGGHLVVPSSYSDQLVIHKEPHAIINSHGETVQAFSKIELTFQQGGEIIRIYSRTGSTQAPVILGTWYYPLG